MQYCNEKVGETMEEENITPMYTNYENRSKQNHDI